ncbi:hypothetical protein L5470_12345 [Synechococcus sp. PCC 6717]|nr:hypothetical protein [Thermostichus lividus]MCI3281748.1 hypothetical protein [Synechococcus sp. PCC 6717]
MAMITGAIALGLYSRRGRATLASSFLETHLPQQFSMILFTGCVNV